MSRKQNDSSAQRFQLWVSKASRPLQDFLQRVHHRVSRHVKSIRRHSFPKERFRRTLRRREVQIRQSRHETAIHFFGKRLPLITRAEPCFYVANAHAMLETNKRRCKGGRRVSLDQ